MLNHLLLFFFQQQWKNDIQEESALESHHPGGLRVSQKIHLPPHVKPSNHAVKLLIMPDISGFKDLNNIHWLIL